MRLSRRARILSFSVNELEKRLVMAAPVLGTIANVQVPAGKTLMIPVTATDADGDPLSYTVTGDNGQILANVRAGHPFLKMSVQGYGDMVFQLFDDIAPNTVQTISSLVNQGFYDGLTIHRIVQNFVIQGGDPNGNGSGGPGFKFDDEFSPEAIFSGNGQLAMANSGKDTNGSQFFVTVGPQRFLDFNHAIYGQLVRGFDVLSSLNNATAPPNIVINSMSFVTDTTDTVLQLVAPSTGTTQFTVTVTDPNGNTDTKTFSANTVTDTTNDPPILGPVSNVKSYTNKQIIIPLTSFDYENDAVVYQAAFGTTPNPGTFVVNGSNIVLTPNPGYKGTFTFRVGVRQANAVSRGSTQDPFDIQDIQIQIADPFTTTSKTVTVNESASLADSVIGTFVPAYPKALTDYEATIDWGNGNTSSGQLTLLGNGTFEVRGTHYFFSRFGNYPVTITVRDKVDDVSAQILSTVVINDAPISASFVAPTRDSGSGLINNAIVAQITDSNINGLIGDLTATINWGNGSTTSGVISTGDGVYLVKGSNTYATFGNFTVTVNVTSLGGKTAQASGSVLVANAAPVITTIADQSTPFGTAFSIPVTATDSDSWQTLQYAFGSTPPSGVTINPQTGLIGVSADVAAGNYQIQVAVTDNGVPSRTSTKSFNLLVESLVNEPPVLEWVTTPPASVLNTENYQASGRVTDTVGAGVLGAVVNYGDGSGYQLLTVAPDGTYQLDHKYETPGNYLVRVRGVDQAGLASEIQTNVQVVSPVTQAQNFEIIRGRNGQLTGIRLFFSGPLDAASAGRLGNYQLVSNPGRDRTYGTRDDRLTRIQFVRYDATNNSVTLAPRGRVILRGAQTIRLRAIGLLDASNILVDGSRNGQPGGDIWLNVSATSANYIVI